MIQNGVFEEALAKNTDIKQLGFVFIGYLIFTIFMTIGATETNKVLFIIFVLIDLLFVGLSLSTMNIFEHSMHYLATYRELAISIFHFMVLLSMY